MGEQFDVGDWCLFAAGVLAGLYVVGNALPWLKWWIQRAWQNLINWH